MSGVDVKRGDWRCPTCGTNVFASKNSCFKCGTTKPNNNSNNSNDRQQPGRKPDWLCPNCNFMVFGSKSHCGKCNVANPTNSSAAPAPSSANNNNNSSLSSNSMSSSSLSSPSAAPTSTMTQSMRGGDWHCPSCNDVNFGTRIQCRKCGTARPTSSASSSAVAETSSEDCVVCMDKKAEAVFAPCGHRCCCNDCAKALAAKPCPKCRAKIESIVKKIYD